MNRAPKTIEEAFALPVMTRLEFLMKKLGEKGLASDYVAFCMDEAGAYEVENVEGKWVRIKL